MDLLDDLSRKEKITYGSGAVGLILLMMALILYISGMQSIGGSLIVAGIIIGAVPPGLYSYLETKKYQAMESEFPAFLRNLSESIKSGMSLPQAFQNASRTDYGRLNKEIRIASDQLSWGIPFPEVMERFQNRVEGSGLITRSVSVIMQSYEAGGDVAETMDAIARDASKIKEAERERRAVLMQQVVIIYVIYLIFVGILIALYKILVPLLNIEGGGGFMGSPPNFCNSLAAPICGLCEPLGLGSPSNKLCYYKSIFFLMVMVEGVFNALVAGEIETGEIGAGVKHALIMVPVGFVLYVGAMNLIG